MDVDWIFCWIRKNLWLRNFCNYKKIRKLDLDAIREEWKRFTWKFQIHFLYHFLSSTTQDICWGCVSKQLSITKSCWSERVINWKKLSSTPVIVCLQPNICNYYGDKVWYIRICLVCHNDGFTVTILWIHITLICLLWHIWAAHIVLIYLLYM